MRIRAAGGSPTSTAAFGLFIAATILAFPELIPVYWRVGVATVVTVAALATSVGLLRVTRPGVRIGAGILALAFVASWAVMPARDPASIRHFSGVGLGLCAMGLVAAWAGTHARLLTSGLVFAVGSLAVLVTGLLGTSVNTGKFVGALRELPAPLVSWLPQVPLGLPGIDGSGYVNPNALGGTALLLLPACCGIAAAAFGSRGGRLALAAALAVIPVAVLTIAITRSRTALVATLLILMGVLARSLWHRKWVLLALAVAVTAAGYWIATFGGEAMLLVDSARTRAEIWREGLLRLREAPWLGIGINQFHSLSSSEPDVPPHVAHAHNILLQVALDAGLIGASGYVLLVGSLLVTARGVARRGDAAGRIATGAAVSLIAVHLFGVTDAIAPGAKVGLFQWLCGGLILAAARQALPPDEMSRAIPETSDGHDAERSAGSPE